MPSVALYQITDAYKQLEAMLDQEVDEAEFFAAIDTIDGALKEKATDIAKFIKNLEVTAEAIENAEKQMSSRRKAIENRVKSIKEYLMRNMQSADILKIECPYFKISRQKNPPLVVIDNPDEINIRYLRQPEPPPPAIDKRAILDDIKNGVIVDGAHMEQNERLVIK